jgi:hypothetical protein
VIARGDARSGKMVREPVSPFFHLGVGATHTIGHEVLAFTEDVDGMLEEIGKIELHRR